MKTRIQMFVLLAISFFFAACAHHRDVRPGANGVHRVVIPTEDTDAAARNGMDQAEHFCQERYQNHAVIVDEKKAYTGSMKEEDYKRGKTISKVAQAVGGSGYVFGGQNERTAGGLVGLGGAIGDSALGKGYEFSMNFKCAN